MFNKEPPAEEVVKKPKIKVRKVRPKDKTLEPERTEERAQTIKVAKRASDLSLFPTEHNDTLAQLKQQNQQSRQREQTAFKHSYVSEPGHFNDINFPDITHSSRKQTQTQLQAKPKLTLPELDQRHIRSQSLLPFAPEVQSIMRGFKSTRATLNSPLLKPDSILSARRHSQHPTHPSNINITP